MSEKIKISKSEVGNKVVSNTEKDLRSSSQSQRKGRVVNFEYLSFWTIVVLVFLMPVFFLPAPILGFSQSKMTLLIVGTMIALVLFVISKLKAGTIKVSRSPVYVVSVLIVASYLISSFTGLFSYRSLIGSVTEVDTFISILTLFTLMFLVSVLSKNSKRMFIILTSLFSSFFIVMMSQVLRMVLGQKMFGFGILDLPTNTLVGSWGELTLVSLMFLVALVIILETVRLRRWVAGIACVFLVVPLIFVVLSGLSFDFYFFSIGLLFLIALASVVIFAYLFSLRKLSRDADGNTESISSKSKFSASLFLLLVSIVMVLFGAQVGNYLSSSTGVTYIEGRPNWQSTISVASNVIAERLFFGSGPNTFITDWNTYKSPSVNNYVFWNNEYNFGVGFVPTSLATVGAVGFMLWVLFYVFVFMFAFKVLFGSHRKEHNTVIHVIVASGSIVTSCMLILYSPGIVVIFAHMIFVGLLVATAIPHNKSKEINFHEKQWHNFVSTIGGIVVLVGCLYVVYIVGTKVLANYYYRSAVLGADIDKSINLIQKSIQADPSEPLYYQTGAQLFASKVSSVMTLSQSEISQKKEEINNYILSAVNYSVMAEQANPTDYKSKIVTGKLLEFFAAIGLKDASEGAIQKYLLASSQIPSNPLPLLFASSVSLGINDKVAAKEYLTKAISLKSDYSDVPDLGKEIQGLVDELNKVPVREVERATTTDEEDSK